MSEHRSIVITPASNSPRYNYVKVQYHHHPDPLWCHCQTVHLDKKKNNDEFRKLLLSCHLSDFSAKKKVEYRYVTK